MSLRKILLVGALGATVLASSYLYYQNQPIAEYETINKTRVYDNRIEVESSTKVKRTIFFDLDMMQHEHPKDAPQGMRLINE